VKEAAMEKRTEFDVIQDTLAVPYELAYGPTWTRFFEGFQQEKILGSRCSECGRVLVPARSYCPRCFVEIHDFIEVSQEGTLMGWVLTDYRYYGMPTEPPFVSGFIKLDGTDCNFLHLIGGIDLSDPDEVRRTIKTGIKVRAVWNKDKRGQIMDIKYFTPVK